jgi:hypothetical protein
MKILIKSLIYKKILKNQKLILKIFKSISHLSLNTKTSKDIKIKNE